MTAAANDSRLVHVEPVWDTVVSIHLLARGTAAERALEPARDAIVGWLHRVDEILSPFQAGSDLERWRRGDATLAGLAPELTEVLGLADDARERTGGAFDPEWRGGRADPTGLVKGWAVDRAAAVARQLGISDLQLNAGGDVRTAGANTSGEPWRVGVEDPRDGDRLIDIVAGHELCIATSSARHRGEHVRRTTPAPAVLSATVAGPDLTSADAYSTAALAAGDAAVDFLPRLRPDGYESLLLRGDGTIWVSAAWPGELNGGGA